MNVDDYLDNGFDPDHAYVVAGFAIDPTGGTTSNDPKFRSHNSDPKTVLVSNRSFTASSHHLKKSYQLVAPESTDVGQDMMTVWSYDVVEPDMSAWDEVDEAYRNNS